MEKRVLLAIVLCIIVLVAWERFFVPKRKPTPPSSSPKVEQASPASAKPETVRPEQPQTPVSPASPVPTPSFPAQAAYSGKDVVVETPLYRAVFTETGGRIKSFVLNRYRENIDRKSPGKELVKTSEVEDLPLAFNFANNPVAALNLAPYVADQGRVKVVKGENKTLSFQYEAPGWLRITRQYQFYPDTYLIDLSITVENLSGQPWENAPTLSLINLPFSSSGGSRYSFQGPAFLVNNELQEVKFKKIKGEMQVPGPVDWLAYTSQYFTMALVPQNLAPNHSRLKAVDTASQMVESIFIGPKITLQPGARQEFRFKLYLGPKEEKILKAADPKLKDIINYGWFDSRLDKCIDGKKHFSDFKYHTSWDWLMPVVRKIKDWYRKAPKDNYYKFTDA